MKLNEFDPEKITFPDVNIKTVSKPKKVHVIKDENGKEKSHLKNSDFEREEIEFTPKLPHPYLDPPKEVEGQLLRYWSKDEKEANHDQESSNRFPPR